MQNQPPRSLLLRHLNQVVTSNSSVSTPTRGDFDPLEKPDLFQIDVNNTQATLYFSPVSNVNKYYITYGNGENTNKYGVEFDTGISNGVLSYTINALIPNTEYSFIVRGGYGCMPGEWGNVLTINTSKTISVPRSFRTGQMLKVDANLVLHSTVQSVSKMPLFRNMVNKL